MADSEGGSEQDDVSFLRTVSLIPPWASLYDGMRGEKTLPASQDS